MKYLRIWILLFALTLFPASMANAYNSTDLSILGLAMGLNSDDAGFPTLYDLDNDGEITSTDLSIMGLNLGREHYFIEITGGAMWDTPWGYRMYMEATPLVLEVVW